jgi:hypothetical protein
MSANEGLGRHDRLRHSLLSGYRSSFILILVKKMDLFVVGKSLRLLSAFNRRANHP